MSKFTTIDECDQNNSVLDDGMEYVEAHFSVHEEKNYTDIPNWLIDLKFLSPNATLILMTLKRNKPGFTLWDKTMMERLRIGRDVYREALKELRELGYSGFRYDRNPNGSIKKKRRIIALKPIFLNKNPDKTTESLKSSPSVEPTPSEETVGSTNNRSTERLKFRHSVGNNKTIDLNNKTRSNNTNTQKKKNPVEVGPDEQALHDCYLDIMKPRANFKLTKDRLKTYQKVLANHPLDHCKQAILGCSRHDWSMGRAPESDGLNNSPEIIFREKNFNKFFTLGAEDYVKPKAHKGKVARDYEILRDFHQETAQELRNLNANFVGLDYEI